MDKSAVICLIVLLLVLGCMSKYAGGVCSSGSGESCLITFFHRPSCGYCTKMNGDWDTFVSQKPSWVKTRKINVSDPKNKSIASKYNIRGVPHIVKEKRGRKEVYSGNRKANNLLSWSKN
jgi:hypothetical protein